MHIFQQILQLRIFGGNGKNTHISDDQTLPDFHPPVSLVEMPRICTYPTIRPSKIYLAESVLNERISKSGSIG